MAAVLFCGCDKEEGGDNLPCPVTEVSVPASSEENPVSPGSSVTIQGQGFTANSEIWLRAITRAADVQAEVTDVTATTVTFTAPDVSGEQNILLKQDGGEWILGVLHFPEVPNTPGGDEEEPAILPTRISHVRVTWEEDMTFVLRYTYDAEGRIVTITETDQQYNFEGAPDESFEDEVTTIEYAPDRIVVTEPEGAQSIYALADGRTTAITSIPGGGVYLSDYTFSYDEMDISLKVHGLKIPVANIVPSRSIPLSTAVLFECKKKKALKSGMVGMPSTKMTRYSSTI